MNRFSKGSLLAGTIMAGAMIATPAYAQDQEEGVGLESGAAASEDNFIVVTGSRIQRRNVETAAPVAVVAAEEFQLSGTVTFTRLTATSSNIETESAGLIAALSRVRQLSEEGSNQVEYFDISARSGARGFSNG